MNNVSYQDSAKEFNDCFVEGWYQAQIVSSSNNSDSERFILQPEYFRNGPITALGILLAFLHCGENNMRRKQPLAIVGTVAMCLMACSVLAGQTPAPPPLSPTDKQIAEAFEKRAKDYSKMREALEEKMPKLSKEAKPEEIQAHKTKFQEQVRNARLTAKRGDVFTPDAMTLIRKMIKDEFKGRERVEFRDTVLREAENKAVPLRVNYPYPESQELIEMPPTLLLRLPQLPKQLRYRFVRSNLLLVDRENGLIVDYMTNALP